MREESRGKGPGRKIRGKEGQMGAEGRKGVEGGEWRKPREISN